MDCDDNAAGRRVSLLHASDRWRDGCGPIDDDLFGSGWYNSGIEIPESGADYYSARNVPPGHVSRLWYFSTVTEEWRQAFVYSPRDYEVFRTRYPVLYLLHGWGEDETGWYRQGHVDFIMDNLIAAGKAKPMIAVLDNLNAVKPGESAAIIAARGLVPDPPVTGGEGSQPRGGASGARGAGPLGRPTYSEMMIADLIPMIKRPIGFCRAGRIARWLDCPWAAHRPLRPCSTISISLLTWADSAEVARSGRPGRHV